MRRIIRAGICLLLLTSAAAAKPDCPPDSKLYRSPLYNDKSSASYQELQFIDGAQNGKLKLTEYRRGKPTWIAQGEFTCSNGFSICRVNFPLMLAGSIELPYETVDKEGAAPEMIVIPAFRQEVYQTEQYAVLQGKSYGGFVADLLGGRLPKEDEPLAPYNIYRYAKCAKAP
ncbi:hypothetical protein MCHK_08955 [Mesorhizobium huakuii 7653R]|nr:hypothetical protein MCHK_08955 [Mesorhizobium huakuii 7653R]